ncbi:MAG: hypothetical protein MI975_05925 [Cytophagales bacterium]|nr:hypothetical protein [Cytophagales bacterium]
MKTKNILLFTFLGALILSFSCSEMNDLHQEYMDRGEQIYLGKVDSTIVYSGNERIKLKCIIKADPKITNLKVTWNSGNNEIIVPVIRENVSTDTIDLEIDPIPEGDYVFIMTTLDNNGNSSIPVETVAKVYGEKYINRLLNKSIEAIDAGLSYGITWKANSEAVGVRIKYIDAEGNEQIIVTPEGEQTILDSWKTGSVLEYQTSFKPHENSLELFYAPVETITLPEDFMVPKSGFNTVTLPFDVAGTMWGGAIHKLWNGAVSNGDFMHTGAEGDPMPQHITFDMGLLCDLTRVYIEPRYCCFDALPMIFEVWGIDGIDGAATEVNSNDPNWEADMISKGWSKLARVEQPKVHDREHGIVDINIEDGSPSVRYIRLYFIENMTDPSKNYVHMSEATFFTSKVYN